MNPTGPALRNAVVVVAAVAGIALLALAMLDFVEYGAFVLRLLR